MTRHRRSLVAAAALLIASCASQPEVPEALRLIGPSSPQVAASNIATALKVDWESGWPIVETFIDGRGPWEFVLDSGTSNYVIDQRVADELKLERVDLTADGKDVAIPTPGGDAYLQQAARIHELRAGPLVERDTRVVVFDLSPLEQASGTRIDGLLPATAFRDVLLTLDFVGKTATVAAGELPPADGKDVLSLENVPMPYIVVQIDGRPCPVLIDSGSTVGFEWPAAYEASLRFRSQPAVTGESKSMAGSIPHLEARLDGTITWGRHRIVDPIVALSAGEIAVAGVGLLREFRVTFDFAHSRVRFERGDYGPIRSLPRRGLGVGILHGEGAWTVGYVLEGSPAARAGIQVGDRVEAVNGSPVSGISRAARETMMQTKDALRLRVVGTSGTREVTVAVVTFVE